MSPFSTSCALGVLCGALLVGPASAVEDGPASAVEDGPASAIEDAGTVEVDGVRVKLVDYSGPATLSVEASGPFEVRVDVDPRTEREPLTIQVELPNTGRNVWPIIDVEVLDSKGKAVPVRRGGITWHRLLIRVPPKRSTYVVHAVDPPGDRPRDRKESERRVLDEKTGVSATICKWYGGRRAALSLRFDDSHPTHLSKVVPILGEYGYRGTFMVNPGGHPPNSRRRSAFEQHRREWEALARTGDHEFANHTLHHRGAQTDEQMQAEVGDASKAIWKLFPNKSKLAALNLGGGTSWTTTRTLRSYLDRYNLFVRSGSTGMDDVYGNRVATFRRLLENHLERGLWYRVHFHYIGNGLSTSEAHFRAALDIAKQHQSELWIAGMADIYKYETQRRAASLEMKNENARRIVLKVACATDPELYDQPLTIAVTLPKAWASRPVVVTNLSDGKVAARTEPVLDDAGSGNAAPGNAASGGRVLRFDVKPVDGSFAIERTLRPK